MHELPDSACDIVSQQEDRPLAAPNLEVPVGGIQPAVHDLDDLDAVTAHVEPAGSLFSPIPRVTLHGYAKWPMSHGWADTSETGSNGRSEPRQPSCTARGSSGTNIVFVR